MTNVTLSIEESVYKKMKEYSEVKWSEFIRRMIHKKIQELDKLNLQNNDGVLTMLASEESLNKDWDNEKDERWNNV